MKHGTEPFTINRHKRKYNVLLHSFRSSQIPSKIQNCPQLQGSKHRAYRDSVGPNSCSTLINQQTRSIFRDYITLQVFNLAITITRKEIQ